jgi:hypothetical protein
VQDRRRYRASGQGSQGSLHNGVYEGIHLLLGSKDNLLRGVEEALDGNADIVHAPCEPIVNRGNVIRQACEQA